MRFGGFSACLVLVCAGAAPAPWGLAQLMGELGKVVSITGQFSERKTIHLLSAPLLASGTLEFVAPDYLRKTTTSPAGQTFLLDHGVATISGGPGGATNSFALAANPRIAGLVEGIRATLAGDLPTLKRFYSVRLSGDDAHWQLYLQPRDAGLAHFVKWMIIAGSGDRVLAIDTANGDGDHSEMGINETSINVR